MANKYHTIAYIMEINRILPFLSTAMVDIENGAGNVSETDAAVNIIKMIKETNFVGTMRYYSELFGKMNGDRISLMSTPNARNTGFPVTHICDAIAILLEIGCTRIRPKPIPDNNKVSMEYAISLIEFYCK